LKIGGLKKLSEPKGKSCSVGFTGELLK